MSTMTADQNPVSHRIPPVLYLTCRPGATTERAEIEMRRLEDGRVALMAYSALDRSMLAEHAWDNRVPDSAKEAIDDGLEDFGEGGKDVASKLNPFD